MRIFYTARNVYIVEESTLKLILIRQVELDEKLESNSERLFTRDLFCTVRSKILFKNFVVMLISLKLLS